ncbi:unnamed protein product, partial [marine sediment metagenome]
PEIAAGSKKTSRAQNIARHAATLTGSKKQRYLAESARQARARGSRARGGRAGRTSRTGRVLSKRTRGVSIGN